MTTGRRTDDPLARDLSGIVGPAHVLVDEGLTAGYEVDWTGRFRGRCRAVVRPASAAEVASVVGACAEHGSCVVPQGGNTGLVGGGVPVDGGVVLSTRRLFAMGEPDPVSSQVEVGAGVTLGALQEHLAGAGLQFALDLAARDSATVGGMAATNAGGTRVLRRGTMRANVAGIEAVLAGGSVVRQMRGLAKDTSGYDLASLLVGSEGTLGVITSLRLSVGSVPAERAAALVGTSDVSSAVEVAARSRGLLDGLESAELVDGATLDLVCRRRNLAPPLERPAPWYLLLQCAGRPPQSTHLASALDELSPAFTGAVVAEDGVRVTSLWRYRELATEVLAAEGTVRKLDVSVPVGSLQAFIDELGPTLEEVGAGYRAHVFGHLLDGNLHCNLLEPEREGPEEQEAVGAAVDEAVLRLAVSLGGSIGAEHGIGRAKRRYLSLVRSAQELEAFESIKRALDPGYLLNPGVLLSRVAGPLNGARGVGDEP